MKNFCMTIIVAAYLGLIQGCSVFSEDQPSVKKTYPIATEPDSICVDLCNAVPITTPSIRDSGGYGLITSYGDAKDPKPSEGGACSYGSGNIMNYAAAGDAFWNGGHICGQCILVQTPSPNGFRSVIVRIVNQCPDSLCGIDLGGAPALQLMGNAIGRYAGKWKYVSCNGVDSVSDGSPSLFVKEGSNSWWSLLQVRNGPGATLSIDYTGLGVNKQGSFSWATEAENFFKVPDVVLSDTSTFTLAIRFSDGSALNAMIKGTDMGIAKTVVLLK